MKIIVEHQQGKLQNISQKQATAGCTGQCPKEHLSDYHQRRLREKRTRPRWASAVRTNRDATALEIDNISDQGPPRTAPSIVRPRQGHADREKMTAAALMLTYGLVRDSHCFFHFNSNSNPYLSLLSSPIIYYAKHTKLSIESTLN